MTIALIVVGYLAFSLLLAVGVGRFIRAGHRPTPPTPPYRVGEPTTYRRRVTDQRRRRTDVERRRVAKPTTYRKRP